VITALVFARTLHQDFVNWDDPDNVVDNPYLARLTSSNLVHFWTHPYESLYIPLSYMLYAIIASASRMSHLDRSISNLDTLFNPHYFHATNVVLHVLNAALVFAILRKLTRHEWASLAGALLFAVHPLQVESVAWVSELRGLLSALFCLIAIYCYIVSVSPTSQPSRTGRTVNPAPHHRPTYWIALIAAIAASLSKPTAICLPLALFVIDHWMLGRPARTCAISVAPWLAIAVPFAAVTLSVQPVSHQILTAAWTRPFIAGDALAFYLLKLICPIGLTINYGRSPTSLMQSPAAFLTWLVPAALAALVYFNRGSSDAAGTRLGNVSGWTKSEDKRTAALPLSGAEARPFLVAGCLFSLAFLLPVLGLSPFAYQEYSTVADRYMYLPMFGPALILAALLAESLGAPGTQPRAVSGSAMSERTRTAALSHSGAEANPDAIEKRPGSPLSTMSFAIAGAVLVAFAVATVFQVRYWDNSVSLFGRAVQSLPSSYAMRSNYGVALSGAGRVRDALAQFKTALTLNPGSPEDNDDMGVAYEQMGDLPDAVAAFQSAVQIDSGSARIHRNLGMALLKQNDTADALAQLQQALQIAPGDAASLRDYGDGLRRAGRFDEAAQEYEASLAIVPDTPSTLSGLAAAYFGMGRYSDAADYYSRAIQGGLPSDQTADAQYWWGRALLGEVQPADARAHFQAALQIDPGNPEYQEALQRTEDTAAVGGMADVQRGIELANAGQMDQAISVWQDAAAKYPKLAEAHGNLGVAYYGKGEFAAAVREFNAALAVNPQAPEVELGLGAALAAEGNKAGAIAAYNKALALEPGYPDALNALQQLGGH
jgi:tetratricopeptide (TPR) repeat protein